MNDTSGTAGTAGAFLSSIFADMVAEGWHERPHTTGQAADEALFRTQAADEEGETAAAWTLSRALHDWFRREWNVYLRREKQDYWIGHDGRPANGVRRVPLRQAIPTRRADGTPTGGYQRPLIWALSWDEWQDKYDAYLRQTKAIAVQVDLYRQVLALRTKYPDAPTPLQACELAGLDIDNLGFEAI